ncbi:hypothetical protein UNDKW_4029 [Undibacterium sp. KW1]|nr:hypothetical protein UNDKW_4029 [Undibacterium sp. KW1]
MRSPVESKKKAKPICVIQNDRESKPVARARKEKSMELNLQKRWECGKKSDDRRTRITEMIVAIATDRPCKGAVQSAAIRFGMLTSMTPDAQNDVLS